MKKFFTSIIAALAAASAAMAITVKVGYELSGEEKYWGTSKAEIYNAAILVDDATLRGKKVTAIEFSWREGVTATDCQVFISSELKVKSGVAVGDIATASYTAPQSGICTVKLAEPWVVDRSAFYVGYSFKVGNPKDNEALSEPLCLGYCKSDDANYLATSRTYKGWQKPAALNGAGFTVRAIVEGDSSDDAAGVKSVSSPVTNTTTAGKCIATIVNHGAKEVKSIDYTYEVAGKTTSGSYTFETPVSAAIYGAMGTMKFEAPVVSEIAEHAGVFTITKVNGVANTDPMSSAKNTLSVTDQIGRHVVVMEEFTGTWCQWCSRGYVAMRMLNEELGDNFIALSYHSGDPMEITEETPVPVDGYPMASIEREGDCDPYYGTGDDNFGILEYVNAHMEQSVPANMSVNAVYNEDFTRINIDAEAYFFRSYPQNPFRMAYFLTADGLTLPADETEPKIQAKWMQGNAYAKYPASELPGGEDFCKPNGTSYMVVPFDDVVVAYSPFAGEAASLPASVQFGQGYSHSYSFDITNIKENEVNGNPARDLIQNRDKVYAVAVLIDTATGRIVNAAKSHVTGASGVSAVTSDRTVESVEYFDLSGRRIKSAPAAGIVIERTRYTDGTQSTAKRVF